MRKQVINSIVLKGLKPNDKPYFQEELNRAAERSGSVLYKNLSFILSSGSRHSFFLPNHRYLFFEIIE